MIGYDLFHCKDKHAHFFGSEFSRENFSFDILILLKDLQQIKYQR